MSTDASPVPNGRRASANANNDADSIMPLLFATIGNPAISFKKMAAMDESGRTESSLEHKFRKWRQMGREIAAGNPEHAGTLGIANGGATTTKKPHAPARNGANSRVKKPIKRTDVGDEEDEIDEMGGIGNEILPSSTKGKATTTNSTKKRAASGKVASAEHEDGKVPAKKVKMVKKGTAKVVKKPNAKACAGSEAEDTISEDEEEAPTKPQGKGRSNVTAANGKVKAAAKPTGSAKAKKGKADVAAKTDQISIVDDEGANVDMDLEDDHDGMVDMQFDGAA